MQAEAKVVILALLILSIGFFYTNMRDHVTGYASTQKSVDINSKDIDKQKTQRKASSYVEEAVSPSRISF